VPRALAPARASAPPRPYCLGPALVLAKPTCRIMLGDAGPSCCCCPQPLPACPPSARHDARPAFAIDASPRGAPALGAPLASLSLGCLLAPVSPALPAPPLASGAGCSQFCCLLICACGAHVFSHPRLRLPRLLGTRQLAAPAEPPPPASLGPNALSGRSLRLRRCAPAATAATGAVGQAGIWVPGCRWFVGLWLAAVSLAPRRLRPKGGCGVPKPGCPHSCHA
jgi:hypothetical protein